MSVCAQTDEDGGTEEMGAPVRDIYEHKSVSKVVRVLTVLAYLLSVSLAAILLSVYYVCVWKSPELPPIDDDVTSARLASPDAHYYRAEDPLIYTGGSNTTMSENITQMLTNVTEGFLNSTDISDEVADMLDLSDAVDTGSITAAADAPDLEAGVT